MISYLTKHHELHELHELHESILAMKTRVFLLLLGLGILAFAFGCSQDNVTGPAAAPTGTIVIEQTPDALVGAGWLLSGPQNETGTGNKTLTSMPVGQYTVTWSAVSGYTAPSSQQLSLAADGTTTFSGTYSSTGSGADGFVLIPAGTFTMGSPTSELGRDGDETQHTVTLTKGFYISPYEVTEELWDSVMGSGISTSQLPQVDVSWYDAIGFCNALSVQNGLTPAYMGSGTSWTWNQSANGYRLPSEAEWEYACRAGSVTAFANGPITFLFCNPPDPYLDVMGWYCGNAVSTTHNVGGKQANAWGLYDLHGNVLEWCWDVYVSYAGDVTDPTGPSSGSTRVIRGGSWRYNAQYCRSAYRLYNYPSSYPSGDVGFRVVRSAF